MPIADLLGVSSVVLMVAVALTALVAPTAARIARLVVRRRADRASDAAPRRRTPLEAPARERSAERTPPPALVALLAAAAAVTSLAVQVQGWPIAWTVRAVIDDPSTTTTLLAAGWLAHRLHLVPAPAPHDRRLLQWALLLGAVTLYPATLGTSAFEPYRWGYGAPAFVIGLLAFAAVAAWRGAPLTAACVAVAIVAWSLDALAAPNLWNLLLDPLVAIWAAASLCAAVVRAIVHRAGAARRRS